MSYTIATRSYNRNQNNMSKLNIITSVKPTIPWVDFGKLSPGQVFKWAGELNKTYMKLYKTESSMNAVDLTTGYCTDFEPDAGVLATSKATLGVEFPA